MSIFAIAKNALIAAALVGIAGSAQAAPHRSSAGTEREQTKALNEQQLEQVRQQNAGLVINAQSTAVDATATAANNLPQIAPVPAP